MNNPYPTAFPYGNGMFLHFYQQQESSTTKTVNKVINKGLKSLCIVASHWWEFPLNFRCTVTIDSVLANSKTQNAFLFTANAIFRQSRLPHSGGIWKYAKAPSTKKTWRDSLPIDMLLSAVSVLVVTQSSSEIPEGLMNNYVYYLLKTLNKKYRTAITNKAIFEKWQNSDTVSWFYLLYSFFLVIPWHLNFKCQHFAHSVYSIFIGVVN